MAEKVQMLALSPTMETGTIVKWIKGEGDEVSSGEVLCEVETDKAVMEYESVNEGTLLKIVVPEGGEAKVGQAIAVVGDKGEDIEKLVEEIEAESAGTSAATPKVPTEEAEVMGAAREEAPEAAELAGGRQAAGPGPSGPPRGEAPKPAGPVEAEAGAGAAGQTEGAVTAGRPAAGAGPEGAVSAPGGVKASPLARRLAEQQNIDLSSIRGSGPGGRVIKRDVEAAASGAAPRRAPEEAAAPGSNEPYQPGEMPVQKTPASGMRRTIARRLAESKFSAPHFYLKSDIDVGPLMQARTELNDERARQGLPKVSFNAFIIRLAAEALRRHPNINAGWEDDAILTYGRADIGVAVALPDGLITPVVRDCWDRGIIDIDADLRVLIDRARSGRLKPQEYTGATFTISSLGGFGVNEFTAIINPPGSAILAVGEARRMPVVTGSDDLDMVTIMTVTMSCDHRVIDGANGAVFLSDLKQLIEKPVRALY